MDAVKEQIKPTNGATPDDLMAQIAGLLQAAGYAGLDVVAIGPRTGQPANPLDFLPEGWKLKIVLVKNGNQPDNPGNIY